MTIREKMARAIEVFRGSQIKRRGIAMSKDGDEEFSYVLIDDLIDLVAEVESKLGLFSFMSLDGEIATLTVYDKDSSEDFVLKKRLPEKVFMLLSEKNLTVEYLSLESRVMRSMYRNLYKITGLIEGEEEKESFLAKDFEVKCEETKAEAEAEVKEEASPSPDPAKEECHEALVEEDEKREDESAKKKLLKEAINQNTEFNLESLLYDDNDFRDEEETSLKKEEVEEEDLEDEEESEEESSERSLKEAEISKKVSNFLENWSASEDVAFELYEKIMTKLFNEPLAILDKKLKEVPEIMLDMLKLDVDKVLKEVEEEIAPFAK